MNYCKDCQYSVGCASKPSPSRMIREEDFIREQRANASATRHGYAPAGVTHVCRKAMEEVRGGNPGYFTRG